MNEGKLVKGVFLDLMKVFISLDRKILLEKIKWYWILNMEWELFASFLCNRKQFTYYKDFTSAPKCFGFGVPQGIVFFSFLFINVIYDIVHCCYEAQFILHVDETKVYLSSRNRDRLFLQVTSAIFHPWPPLELQLRYQPRWLHDSC